MARTFRIIIIVYCIAYSLVGTEGDATAIHHRGVRVPALPKGLHRSVHCALVYVMCLFVVRMYEFACVRRPTRLVRLANWQAGKVQRHTPTHSTVSYLLELRVCQPRGARVQTGRPASSRPCGQVKTKTHSYAIKR